MGEKGYYFSKGAGVYQSQEYPCVLRCRLDEEMKGVSLMSVTELEKLGFSQQDIEKGYRQLQKESAFIPNDGLPPKDTEVVILKGEGKLKPDVIEVDNKTFTPKEYMKEKKITLHDTWK